MIRFSTAMILISLALPAVARADAQTERLAAVQKGFELAEWLKMVKPSEAGHVQGMTKGAQGCLDALAAMTKEGKADGDKITVAGKSVTIGDARTRCEKALVDATAFEKEVSGREQGNRNAAEEKFKTAGMKGERLKMFTDNEIGGFPWYAAGCETEVKDPKELARSKALFQWTNGKNGGTLVTKVTFSGDTYKISSREFFTEEKAYGFCK